MVQLVPEEYHPFASKDDYLILSIGESVSGKLDLWTKKPHEEIRIVPLSLSAKGIDLHFEPESSPGFDFMKKCYSANN